MRRGKDFNFQSCVMMSCQLRSAFAVEGGCWQWEMQGDERGSGENACMIGHSSLGPYQF